MKISKLCFRGSLLFFVLALALTALFDELPDDSILDIAILILGLLSCFLLPLLGLFFKWLESYIASRKQSTLFFGLSVIFLLTFFILIPVQQASPDQDFSNIAVGAATIGFIVFLPLGLISRSEENNAKFRALPSWRQEQILEAEREARKDYVIASVTLLDSTSTRRTAPTVSRTRIFHTQSAFGRPYMTARTVTRPGKTTVTPATFTFLVEYESGRQEIETVKYKSLRYKTLIKYL